jgi:TetR/AcrR family transcriptional regulator, repressor for divergent bdcA
VSLADLTGVMGINPPSFYAAFGCKAMLFARVLDGYSAALLDQVRAAFADERASNAALADILLMAAHSYAPAPAEGSAPARRGGCLILEAGLNCSDAIVAEYIRKARLALAAILYRGIAKDQPERAAMLTDYMLMQLAGLSAMARDGTAHDRLYSAAQMAGRALTALPDQ